MTKGRKMWDYVKLVVLGLIALCAAIAANHARDLAYQVNAIVVMLAAAGTFLWVLRHAGEPKAASSWRARWRPQPGVCSSRSQAAISSGACPASGIVALPARLRAG